MLPSSDESIFVRSNNVSKPVVTSDSFRAGKRPLETGSGRTGEVGVQSIASSSSSSRGWDCGAGERAGAGADDARGDGGLRVAGLREGWPNTGPVAWRVRRGIGTEERERPSSSSGGSREWRVLVVGGLVVAGYERGGEREVREEVLVLGALERVVDEYIRRTAGAR